MQTRMFTAPQKNVYDSHVGPPDNVLVVVIAAADGSIFLFVRDYKHPSLHHYWNFALCRVPHSLPSVFFRALCRVPRKKASVKENTRRRNSLTSVLFLCRVSFF
jgi:hypothetical protein